MILNDIIKSMISFIKKYLLKILVIKLIILLAVLSVCLWYFDNQKINNLKKENETLNEEYSKAIIDLDAANNIIKNKNIEIENLQKAKNETIRNDIANNTEESGNSTSNQQSSIYDHINGSDEFKNRIINALNLLSSADSEHFQIVTSQVATINEYDNYGGYQEKRNIYIGADDNAAITASLITHEAQHVYNVYVDRIWSYHTKEQELPCYEAELIAAQRLGAPQFFIISVQDNITYWQSQ